MTDYRKIGVEHDKRFTKFIIVVFVVPIIFLIAAGFLGLLPEETPEWWMAEQKTACEREGGRYFKDSYGGDAICLSPDSLILTLPE